VKRRISALIVGGIAAFAIAAVSSRAPADQPQADDAAVAHYLDRLAETVPPPPAVKIARAAPADGKISKSAQRLDRAEPILGAVLDRGR
jgi:hypothetical protein